MKEKLLTLYFIIIILAMLFYNCVFLRLMLGALFSVSFVPFSGTTFLFSIPTGVQSILSCIVFNVYSIAVLNFLHCFIKENQINKFKILAIGIYIPIAVLMYFGTWMLIFLKERSGYEKIFIKNIFSNNYNISSIM